MKYLIPAFILLLTFSCGQNDHREDEAKKKYVDLEGIDKSIKPGDNFFRYVNGKWYDTANIADDQAGVGSYMFLNIPQKVKLQNILEEVSNGEYPNGSIEQKVGDFYASGMDESEINQRGYQPLQPIIEAIDGIKDIKSVFSFVAEQTKSGNSSIIQASVYPDNKNSQVNIVHLSQTGTNLPDRDYYFKTDSATLKIQNAYKSYLAKLFELTGDVKELAKEKSSITYRIEEAIAKSHKTRIERRNVKENYNKIAVSELDERHKNISWNSLLASLGLEADSVDIKQPAYYDKLDEALLAFSINDWKTYLKAHTLVNYASILSQPFQDAEFEYSKVISGQSTQKTRKQLMVQRVDRQLGFALGQLYVKQYFNEEAKTRALDLVKNFTKAFDKRIVNNAWMSDSTKDKAREKLAAITRKIGYPDVWRTYDVAIDRDKFFENVLALRKESYQYRVNQLNKAPDKTRWGTTPSTVTAYYNPSFNEIVFPAGILQYPYFDLNADDAINYGGIGMVIGHELTHAFDDQGAQYDKDGNVKNWWTEEDYKKFKERTQQVVDLYDSFIVLDTVHVKGALTLGENTADIGAISIAYDAFKLTKQGQDTTKIDGLTPDQRFFYSIARIWRVKTRDEFLRNYVNTNSHSPAMWRVNGPLMNKTEFYKAWGVNPGDKNYLPEEERIVIW